MERVVQRGTTDIVEHDVEAAIAHVTGHVSSNRLGAVDEAGTEHLIVARLRCDPVAATFAPWARAIWMAI